MISIRTGNKRILSHDTLSMNACFVRTIVGVSITITLVKQGRLYIGLCSPENSILRKITRCQRLEWMTHNAQNPVIGLLNFKRVVSN